MKVFRNLRNCQTNLRKELLGNDTDRDSSNLRFISCLCHNHGGVAGAKNVLDCDFCDTTTTASYMKCCMVVLTKCKRRSKQLRKNLKLKKG